MKNNKKAPGNVPTTISAEQLSALFALGQAEPNVRFSWGDPVTGFGSGDVVFAFKEGMLSITVEYESEVNLDVFDTETVQVVVILSEHPLLTIRSVLGSEFHFYMTLVPVEGGYDTLTEGYVSGPLAQGMEGEPRDYLVAVLESGLQELLRERGLL